MLVSVSLVIFIGLLLGSLAKKLNMPSLIGLLFTGILLGPSVLNVLSDHFLALSSELRTVALIVILTRAGLSLDLADLKKVGRPAILMCFVPAVFEIMATVLLAPMLLAISVSEALLLGSVIAAVSPAVIVPRMIHLMKEGYGKNKSIPQIILAGASVDDVFVLVLFTAFLISVFLRLLLPAFSEPCRFCPNASLRAMSDDIILGFVLSPATTRLFPPCGP